MNYNDSSAYGEVPSHYDSHETPGSGDGSDDLADYNAAQADNYRNENEETYNDDEGRAEAEDGLHADLASGGEDAGLDAAFEARHELPESDSHYGY